MGIIKAIYNTKPKYLINDEERSIVAIISYQNQSFSGVASCCKPDKDFYSHKVGKRIALARARIAALKWIKKEAIFSYQVKTQAYKEACCFGEKKCNEVDPTGRFKKSIDKEIQRIEKLKTAIKKEELFLREYIKDANYMINIVKAHREKDKGKIN